MNAPQSFSKAIDAQRLAKTAQEIVDAKPGTYSRFMVAEAQCYLDNLSDGYVEPDGLLRELADDSAEDDFQSVCHNYERSNPGYSYTLDFDDWYEPRKSDYLSAVRSTYEVECVG